MLKKLFLSHKRTIAFIGVVVLIFAAALVFSLLRGDAAGKGNSDAYALSDKELQVVSCSLNGMSGVSQGAELEIRYNQLISLSAAGDIDISPAVKGEWRAVDDRLIFTPSNRWEAGTYYQVTINSNGTIRGMGKALKEPTAFSFETQDSALRIPAKASFSVAERQYFFTPEDNVLLKADYSDTSGNVNAAVSVKVWRFASASEFVDTFIPLFSLPEWASISRNKFIGDTEDLEYLGKKDVPLVNGELEYGSLPAGQYLFRLVVGGAACDVAVTVDNISLYSVYSGNAMYLWGHDGDQTMVGEKLRIGESVTSFDKNGCAKMDYNYNDYDIAVNPQVLALQVIGEETSHVEFLSRIEVESPLARGEIIPGNSLLYHGDDLTYTGFLWQSPYASDDIEAVTVSIISDSGVVRSQKLTLEDNNAFSGAFEDIILPEGEYSLSLQAEGKEIASAFFTSLAKEETADGYLFVSQSDSQVEAGDALSFTVKALYPDGRPIVGLNISNSVGAASGVTDSEGEAVFYINGENSLDIPVITKKIVFQAQLGKNKIYAASFYTVTKDVSSFETGEPEAAAPIEDIIGESDIISFVAEKGDFIIEKGESETGNFSVVYADGQYRQILPGSASSLTLSVPESCSVQAGETLAVHADTTGGYKVAVSARLYEGVLPGGAEGQAYDSECAFMPESQAIAGFINDSGDFLFDTAGLNGSYYLCITVKDLTGDCLCRYVPVSISEGGSVVLSGSNSYPLGSGVEFNLLSQAEDLTYSVVLGEEEIAAGEVGENTAVSLADLPLGNYHVTVNIYNDFGLIDQKTMDFTVYSPEPDFMGISDTPTDAAMEIYQVPQDKKEYFLKLFSINLFPGNQLLQVMGRNEFYSALGENAGFLRTYVNNDFTSYQNSDGSFSRLPGAKGDMLLSALVAGNEDAVYDKEALKSFFRQRMSVESDTEVLALAYWGLSLLGEAPVENMVYHLKDDSFTDKAKLYLAEAFWAAGDEENALLLYKALAKDLKTGQNGTYFPKEQEQDSILRALLMLDLSVKLNTDDSNGLLTYLMSAEMLTQTNRYLLSRCLLTQVDTTAVELSQDHSDSDKSLLSVEPWLPKTDKKIIGEFSRGGEKIESAASGEIFSLKIAWPEEAEDNTLYMVYFTDTTGVFLNEDDLLAQNGHVIYLTMATEAEFCLRGIAPGAVMGDVYIFDLTAGKVIGEVEFEDMVVVQ